MWVLNMDFEEVKRKAQELVDGTGLFDEYLKAEKEWAGFAKAHPNFEAVPQGVLERHKENLRFNDLLLRLLSETRLFPNTPQGWDDALKLVESPGRIVMSIIDDLAVVSDDPFFRLSAKENAVMAFDPAEWDDDGKTAALLLSARRFVMENLHEEADEK